MMIVEQERGLSRRVILSAAKDLGRPDDSHAPTGDPSLRSGWQGARIPLYVVTGHHRVPTEIPLLYLL